MAKNFKFTVASLPAGAVAKFRRVPDTQTLIQFTNAADLTLKEVSSFQEAAACGGVLMYDPSGTSNTWVMLAGKTLERALKKGEGHLGKVLHRQNVFQWRQRHLKRVYGNSSGIYAQVAGHTVISERTTSYRAFMPEGDVWVFGVLTKAHGYGLGTDEGWDKLRNRAQMVLARQDLGTPPADWRYEPYLPTWPGENSVAEQLWNGVIKPHGWCLSPEIDLGLARAYYKSNKAKILDKWVKEGGPGEDIMQYYVSEYDAAVDATFAADQRLFVDIPFTGGSDSSAFESDMRVIHKTPALATGFHATNWSARGTDETSLRTTSDIEWQNTRILPDFGFDVDAPLYGLTHDTAFTLPLSLSPKSLRFATGVEVPIRELVGTVSPRAALQPGYLSGIIDIAEIMDGYTDLVTRTPGESPPTDVAGYDSKVAANRNKLSAGESLYLGRFGASIYKFSAVWDQLAMDKARSES